MLEKAVPEISVKSGVDIDQLLDLLVRKAAAKLSREMAEVPHFNDLRNKLPIIGHLLPW